MSSIGGHGGLDLTQDVKPPKTLYIEVLLGFYYRFRYEKISVKIICKSVLLILHSFFHSFSSGILQVKYLY